MDPFTNGLHCIYDHIHHTFIPSQPDDTSAIGQAACDSASLEQRERQEKPELFDDLHPASGNGDYYATESGTAAQERIRRPRNAFMIFRSEFLASNKLKSEVEHDNRHISRIAGHCWNSMTEVEKIVYHVKADQEKIAHMRRFPNYKFTPVARRQKPLKRKVKRNGDDELSRCRRVAELLLEGKEGDELVLAVKNADLNAPMPVEKAEGESEYAEDLRSPTNGTFSTFHNSLYSPENAGVLSTNPSFANRHIVHSPTSSPSLRQLGFPSPLDPLSCDFFANYSVSKNHDYTLPPYPTRPPGYYPATGILSTSSHYNGYIQSPDHSPSFAQPTVFVQSPPTGHHTSFDCLDSSRPIRTDTPYHSLSVLSVRHRPRPTRNPPFHPYDGITVCTSLPLDLDVMPSQFPAHNLRRR